MVRGRVCGGRVGQGTGVCSYVQKHVIDALEGYSQFLANTCGQGPSWLGAEFVRGRDVQLPLMAVSWSFNERNKRQSTEG